jgi:hypothetical protein
MLRQRYAERPTDTVPATSHRTPPKNVTARRFVARALERTLGECLAPNPRSGLLVLVAIVVLLGIIAVTLSVGNALLVLLAAVVMRVSCERGRRPRHSANSR